MKPKCTQARKPAAIANTRWLAYATAGAASAFAAANSAEGTIHYSGPINQRFNGCDREGASFPLAQPGNFFHLEDAVVFCSTSYGGGAYFRVVGLAGASFAGFYNSACINKAYHLNSVSRLERGDPISNRPFVPGGQRGIIALETSCRTGGGQWEGQFDGKGLGFIGFKFNNGGGDQYGWVRIEMQKGLNWNQNFKLLDYAYGDVGDSIAAGQRSGHDVAELESLGGLALGAIGLLAWRKRRSRAARSTAARD